MDRVELLAQAQAVGLQVEVHGEKLRIFGPPHAASLANQLLACKAGILPLLKAERGALRMRAVPLGAVNRACPKCGKPHRLFVPGSPDIPGEPDRDVLICGRCGHTESPQADRAHSSAQDTHACPECGPYALVRDVRSVVCYQCRRRF